jgi:hypothetical protein
LISAAAAEAAAAYEKLRAAVLGGTPTACPGLGIIHRRGLAAWMRALEDQSPADVPHDQHLASSPSPECDHQGSGELAQLITNIIVSIGMEHVHA